LLSPCSLLGIGLDLYSDAAGHGTSMIWAHLTRRLCHGPCTPGFIVDSNFMVFYGGITYLGEHETEKTGPTPVTCSACWTWMRLVSSKATIILVLICIYSCIMNYHLIHHPSLRATLCKNVKILLIFIKSIICHLNLYWTIITSDMRLLKTKELFWLYWNSCFWCLLFSIILTYRQQSL
jgi:hypothetical protein